MDENQLAAMQELYSRGALDPDQKAAFEELQSRGAIPSGANTSNYTPKNPPVVSSAAMSRFGMTLPVGGSTPQEMNQAQLGIDIDTGSPKGVSYLKGSLAVDEAAKSRYYQAQIRKQLGKDVQFQTKDEQGNDIPLQYLNPATKRWTLAEPSTKKSAVGGAIEAVPEAIGSTVGGLAGTEGGPPGVFAGATIGAGIGGFLGSYAKNFAGSIAGVNTPEELGDKSMKAAGEEGAEQSLFQAVLGPLGMLFKGAGKLFFKGGPAVAPNVASRVLHDIQGYQQEIKIINAEAQAPAEGGSKAPVFNPSASRQAFAGQPAGKPPSPESEVALKQQIGLLKTKKYQTLEADNQRQGENTLWYYFRNKLVAPFTQPGQLQGVNTVKDAGDALQGVLDKIQAGIATPAEQEAYQAAQAAGKKAQELNQPFTATDAAEAMRKTMAARFDAVEKNVGNLHDEYRRVAKYSPDQTSSPYSAPVTDGLRGLMTDFQAKMDTAITKQEAGVVKDYLIKIRDEYQPASFVNEWSNQGRVVPANFNLAQLDRAIKYLNKEDFHAQAGEVALSLADRERGQLLGALKDMRQGIFDNEASRGNTALRDAHDVADHAYTDMKQTFDRELIGQALKMDGKSGYRMGDVPFINAVLDNKDTNIAQDIARMTQADPDAHNEMLKVIKAYYAEHYMTANQKTGELMLDVAKHADFMRTKFRTLQAFLTPEEQNSFREAGGIAKSVIDSQERLDNLRKVWQASTGGKFGDMRPESLIKGFFTTKEEGSDIAPVLSLLRHYYGEGPVKNWQNGVVLELGKKLIPQGATEIDLNALRGFMTKNEDKIRLLFGDTYYQDLSRLEKGLSVNRAGGMTGISTPSRSTAFADVGRVAEGPMTMLGRARTALQNVRERGYMNRLYTAMYDPAELHKMANDLTIQTNKAIRNNAALGTGVSILRHPEIRNGLSENDNY